MDVLLSDRDLRAAIDAGRLGVDPFDGVMVQPSSIDVRLDRYFRVFENHRYPHIDPAEEQPDLTRLVEPSQDEPFILHPGEFVLGSTYEVVSLADDLAARLEGKALDLDTPIPTQHGFLLMSEVAPGDVVFDESGAPARVVDVSPVLYGRPCYRVEFSDGAVLIADEAHQWVTRTKHERSKGLPAAVRTTRELAESVRCRAEWNHHVALPGPVEYPARDLPVDPYVLGVWLGDGTSTGAVVTCNDAQVLAEIRTAGYAVDRASGPIAWRIGGTGHTRDAATGRYTRNGSFSSSLRNLRLLGDKHVPEPYFVASIDQRLALIQGLMDSDGYCDEFGRCEYVSTREVLADAVVELAASLGLRPKKRKKRAMLHGIDCGPAYQVKFVPHIPVFRLERKLRRQKPPTARLHRHRAIVAVTPVGSRPVRCIEVDSPSGMYLAGTQYVPTHNSSLGRLGLLTHSTAGFIDPGFNGHVTLELSNVATLPIKLWPGMKIGQLAVFRLSSAAEFPYGSKQYGSRYQGQRGPTPSRSYLNFSRTEV